MTDQLIVCPHCHKSIPLSQALSHQIKKQLSEELTQVHARELAEEKKKLWVKAQAIAGEAKNKELQDLSSQLEASKKKLEDSEKHELKLRQQARDLEEKSQKIELELSRRLDEERNKIQNQVRKQAHEEHEMKMSEKNKQIEIMSKTIEELKRQSQQGSMQIQGEVQEDSLKKLLESNFPQDEVSDVPTGIKGADLVQKILGKMGNSQGIIIWESKNTKAFSESWIAKLKQDQGKVKADAAILVSKVLPDSITQFGQQKGVWIVKYEFAIPLASALRFQLSELIRLKKSMVGQDEKLSQLYRYLSGSQFKNRIENIVLAFMSMRSDLEKEKRSLQALWSKREQEIDKVLQTTASLYGDFQGIIGGSLPTIPQLQLPDGNDELEQLSLENHITEDEI